MRSVGDITITNGNNPGERRESNNGYGKGQANNSGGGGAGNNNGNGGGGGGAPRAGIVDFNWKTIL